MSLSATTRGAAYEQRTERATPDARLGPQAAAGRAQTHQLGR